MKASLALSLLVLAATSPLLAQEEHQGKHAAVETRKVSGEVVDLVCYLDHKAVGEKHADCAKKCIAGGLPVGLKADDGKTYLVVGEHVSINQELAPLAGKKITVEGKVTARDGFNMVENAVVQK